MPFISIMSTLSILFSEEMAPERTYIIVGVVAGVLLVLTILVAAILLTKRYVLLYFTSNNVSLLCNKQCDSGNYLFHGKTLCHVYYFWLLFQQHNYWVTDQMIHVHRRQKRSDPELKENVYIQAVNMELPNEAHNEGQSISDVFSF